MTKNDDDDDEEEVLEIISSYHRALLLFLVVVVVRDRSHGAMRSGSTQRCEKISNSSSFGIIDIADSSTTDRIIVIVDTVRFIHDGACR